ncbi:DUF6415 family natural product biosynthesis protein [Streptomyces sp. NPDC007007]|uniref:DUF6415 family natural product biosynthesis protein n=1 Tax=Streptomyces sp. NPDC007007 TaxID=3364770 RepID=UPI00369D0D25
MTSTHHVLHQDDVDVALPLDRGPYERLAAAVLTRTDPGALPPRDYEHIALQLTGHAREVAADVHRLAGELPPSSGRRALADLVLTEAEQHLAAPPNDTLWGWWGSPRSWGSGRRCWFPGEGLMGGTAQMRVRDP